MGIVWECQELAWLFSRGGVREWQGPSGIWSRCFFGLATTITITVAITVAVAVAIAVIGASGLYANLGGLGSRAIRVENPNSMGMLIATPVRGKQVDAVLQDAAGRNRLTIHQ